MDKASASGAGDCGFESHQGRFACAILFFFFFFGVIELFFFFPTVVDVYFECWTLLVLSLSLTSRNGNQLVQALGKGESMDRLGATGNSILDSFSPCIVSYQPTVM